MRFQDIKQFPKSGYRVNISWVHLENHLENMMCDPSLVQTQPAFQRGYVWTEEQQIAYIEYILRGGKYGRELIWNCPSWSGKYGTDDRQPIVLVDGQQRLGAAIAFLNDKIAAFGYKRSEFEDELRSTLGPDFIFNVFELQTEAEVLELYLALNTGGSIHTEEDLKPAYDMLKRQEEVGK